MPDLNTQNISINSPSVSSKRSPWPISVIEETYGGYVYSDWELEEIKKRAKVKFAEVGTEVAGSDKFIKDVSFVENAVTKHYLPKIIFEVKEEYKKAFLEYEKKVAEDSKKPAETKPLSGQEKSSTIDEIKNYLEANGKYSNGKYSIGSSMVPQIRGMYDGQSTESAKILGNGLIVVKYDSKKKFDDDVANARNQAINSDERIGLNGAKFETLVSIAEITSYGKDSSYKIVSSDSKGVRVNNIDKKTYESLINDKSFADGNEAQKAGNREKLVSRIVNEVLPVRNSMGAGMKKFLLRQCKNDYLFGIIPVPGIIGGRKDRLKAAMKSANFSFSKENGVVVEHDNLFPNRVTVTLNGESNQDTFIPLAHGCAVKVNKDGKIIPDTLFKLGKDGSVKEIDIKGGIFRLPLSMRGNLVNALRGDTDNSGQAKNNARDVMEKYKKLELIVCKDGEKNKENLGMSFMVLGKTHGLRLTDGEKIATTVSAGLLTIGFGFATAGAGTAAVVAATAVGTALAGASTIKGAVDVVNDESLSRTMEGLIPTGGVQRFKSEGVKNITSNQRSS